MKLQFKIQIFRIIYVLGFVSFLIGKLYGQALQISPRFPKRGDEVTLFYRTDRPDSKFKDTCSNIELIFTYSNFYGLPQKTNLIKTNGGFVYRFKMPSYAVYASFYLQSGSIKDQPSVDRQYELAVFSHDSIPVLHGLLYKAYSMSAQMRDKNLIRKTQQALYRQELSLYPDDYETQLRLIASQMDSLPADQKCYLSEKGNAIIAEKYRKDMPSMGTLNLITMGYLILGEKERLDSVRSAAIKDYPESAVAKELLLSQLLQDDAAVVSQKIYKELAKETLANKDGMTDYHEWLLRYYAKQGMADSALIHARKMLNPAAGPYYPVALKDIAVTLIDARLVPDSTLSYAKKSLALLDSFPVGTIRYFPETGYIRPYADDSVKKRELNKQEAELFAIIGQAYVQKSDLKTALAFSDTAQALSESRDVLTRTAAIFAAAGQPGKAYIAYRKILLGNPSDTMVIPDLRNAYRAWKGNDRGLNDSLQAIAFDRKKARTAELKKTALNIAAPSLELITDLKGQPVSPDSLKNKVLVIDFWATWCIPCMHEMPYVQKVYDKYKDNKNVSFLVINSGARNTLTDAQQWQKKVPYTFPVYFHTNPNVGDVFGFNVIPALFVIDRNNLLQFKAIGFEGPSVEETLDLEISLLLSDKNNKGIIN